MMIANILQRMIGPFLQGQFAPTPIAGSGSDGFAALMADEPIADDSAHLNTPSDDGVSSDDSDLGLPDNAAAVALETPATPENGVLALPIAPAPSLDVAGPQVLMAGAGGSSLQLGPIAQPAPPDQNGVAAPPIGLGTDDSLGTGDSVLDAQFYVPSAGSKLPPLLSPDAGASSQPTASKQPQIAAPAPLPPGPTLEASDAGRLFVAGDIGQENANSILANRPARPPVLDNALGGPIAPQLRPAQKILRDVQAADIERVDAGGHRAGDNLPAPQIMATRHLPSAQPVLGASFPLIGQGVAQGTDLQLHPAEDAAAPEQIPAQPALLRQVGRPPPAVSQVATVWLALQQAAEGRIGGEAALEGNFGASALGHSQTGHAMPVGAGQAAPPASTAHIAASITAQVMPMAHAAQSGPVELVLSPAELGELRFEIHQRGENVQIVLSAERADTADLLRRHSDLLLQDFKNAGFSGASLSFGQWGGGRGPAPQFEDDTGVTAEMPFVPVADFTPKQAYLDPSRSLNLRL